MADYGITISVETLGLGEITKLSNSFSNISKKTTAFSGELSKLGKKPQIDDSLGDVDVAPTLPFEKQINKAIDGIKRKIQGITGINLKTDDAKQNIDALKAKINELKEKRSLSLNTAEIKKAGNEINKLEIELKKLESLPSSGIFDKFSKLKSSISPMTGLLAGAFAVGGLTSFGAEVVEVTSEFQKYNAVLTNSFGSQTMANEAMSDLQNFASKTPFQLNNLTESYVKLVNRGFVPTMEEMTKLGDLASSTGKDFDQLVEAVLDAETGEMERLKEFGVKAEKNKDTIAFTFNGITQVVKNDAKSIRSYLLGLGDIKGVKGSMQAISGTLGGSLSNLSDNFDAFKLKIGQAIEPLLKMGIMVANKILSIGEAFLKKVNPYATQLATFINQNMPMVKEMLKGAGIAVGILTGAFALLNVTMLANPAFLIATAIIGLVSAFGYAYATSEKFRSAVWGLWEAGKLVFSNLLSIVKSFVFNTWESLKGLGNLLAGIFTLDFTQIKEGFVQLASGIGNYAKDLVSGTADIATGVGKAYSEGAKKGLASFAKSQEANKVFKQNAIEQEILANQKITTEKSELENAKAKGFTLSDLARYNKSEAKAKGMSLTDFMSQKPSPAKSSSDATTKETTTKSNLGSGISEIKSDSSVAKNININIESLIKEVNFNNTQTRQSTNEVLDMLKQGLMSVVNDVNAQ